MLETLKMLDQNLLLTLTVHHNSFFDPIMWLFSDKLFWAPLYAWFLWLLYKQFPRHYWTVILAVILMIVASDQFCNLAKNGVMRLRPSQDPGIQAMVHIVNDYRGGMYGFYSGHASNAFAVALFMITIAGKKLKYLVPVCLLYATLTAYSRIYLGVHYPGDILIGALDGTLLGTGFALLHAYFRRKYLKLQD